MQSDNSKYDDEVDAEYDPKLVSEARDNLRSMGKEEMMKLTKEGEDIAKQFAEYKDELTLDTIEVQELVEQHRTNLEHFYETTLEVYRGLAEKYVTDKRFKEYYDKYGEGTAEFVKNAINHYCDTVSE